MRKKVITQLCEKPGSGKRTSFGPRNSKTVYQNNILGCLPSPHSTWWKLINMTIKEKYLELYKKSLHWKNNRYLFTYLENRPKNLACTSRCNCLKEEISHKMCWIFHETLSIWLPIRSPIKKIVYASWKVLKICLRASKRWLILCDSVCCCENLWSLGRCFDLCLDKHKHAFSLVEKCRVTSWPCP